MPWLAVEQRVGTLREAVRSPHEVGAACLAGLVVVLVSPVALAEAPPRDLDELRARVGDLAPELAIGNRWDAEQPITVTHLLEHLAAYGIIGIRLWRY